MLGIGAIIGAGFFGLTGEAAAEYAGPAIIPLVRPRRDRLRLRRPLLRRDGLDRPRRRLGLYLRLCHDGRVHRLADRLGPDPRIHGRRHDGRDQLVGLRHQLPATTWASTYRRNSSPSPGTQHDPGPDRRSPTSCTCRHGWSMLEIGQGASRRGRGRPTPTFPRSRPSSTCRPWSSSRRSRRCWSSACRSRRSVNNVIVFIKVVDPDPPHRPGPAP